MTHEQREIATSARHGAEAPRGERPLAGATGGRFGRMFPGLPPCDPGADVLDALESYLRTQAIDGSDNGRIPAGYTYLGQFIDHDITFDPTSNIARRNDPLALVNFRSPRLDLDSLYGGGPADQPFLYDWNDELDDPGVKLLLTRNSGHPDLAPLDLPRNHQGRALIGDARNDENVIVAQLHLLFIRLHNNVVDRVRGESPRISSAAVFEEAQRIVRWHYQWIVINDFMLKVVGTKLAGELRPSPAALPGAAAIPVEFSGAAFRFGHSLVRNDYNLRSGSTALPILREPGDPGQHLGGFRALTKELKIAWARFFWDTASPPQDGLRSMAIDTALAPPLHALPPDGTSLAGLNLRRGLALGLPSGTEVALAMGAGTPLLTDDELRPDGPPAAFGLTTWNPLLQDPPLWYYILCEAYVHGGRRLQGEHGILRPAGGKRLGPVGGRIVAEVLVGLLERDPASYLHHPSPWAPHLRAAAATGEDAARRYEMRDLVRFIEEPGRP